VTFAIKLYTMRKFDRYKENLRQVGDEIYSYSTNVATIEYPNLIQHGWWSVTTQKHINYVAKELGLTIKKPYLK
jgi:hypothetical protein